MIKLSRKVLISVFTLAVTILALGASTFAWFALSTTSQVTDIGGTVSGGGGMRIRLYQEIQIPDPDNPGQTIPKVISTPWKSNLSESDVSTFIGDIKAANFEFKAVTSPEGTSFTKLDVTSDGKLRLGQTTVANADYLQFKIQFRSAAEGEVVLTNYDFNNSKNELKTIVIDSGNYLQYSAGNDGTVKTAHPVETMAAYGARVSFEPTVGTGSLPTVYQHIATDPEGLTMVTTGSDSVIKGNYVMEQSAVAVGQWSYLTEGLGTPIFNATGDTAITLPTATIADAKTAVKDTNDVYYTQITLANNPTATDDAIKANFGEFTVRLWIEGWDADTYDVILDMPLFVSLEFKKLP